MLYAERHGKLGRDSSRAHSRAEDLLTSTAFQLLGYVAPKDGLLAVLSRVRRIAWERGDLVVMSERPSWLKCDAADGFGLEFWPWWRGAGQPDVLVRLLRGPTVLSELVVEVKLDSPKSPRATIELDDGVTADNEEQRRPDQLWDYFNRLRREPGNHSRGLVYLTSHAIPPIDELRESLSCCADARLGDWLGWLSWWDVWAVLHSADPQRARPARDLADILRAKGFNSFEGFHGTIPPVPSSPRRFFHPWFASGRRWSAPAGSQSFWAEAR